MTQAHDYEQWLRTRAVDVPRPTSVHCDPLPIPPRLAARLYALEAGHWATEGIRGAVYRAVAGRSRIIHTDTAIGTIEVPNEHT